MSVNSPNLISTQDDDIAALPINTADERLFSEYYDKEVKSAVDEMEAARLVAVAESGSRKPAAIWIAVIGAIFLGIIAAWTIGEVFGFGIFILIGILVAWVRAPISAFEASRDDQVIPRIVAYFPGFKYRRDVPVDTADLYKAAIIPVGDRQKGGDSISGVHNETGMLIAELKTTETRGSGKNRRTVTLFNGLLLTIEFEKPFDGVTLVERDGGSFSSVLPTVSQGRSLEVVSLEDPDFEKEFRVRSTDQVEARYLLTPDFMVRLHDLHTHGHARGLRSAFIDKKFYLAVPTDRDYFELGGAHSNISNLEQALVVYRDIRDMLAIVDTLKINAGRRVRTDHA